jgi:hypothetical protein
MKWQVKYALEKLRDGNGVILADHAGGEAIRVEVREQPKVLAVISDTDRMTTELASHYHREWPGMDFLCGFRKECIWEGGAITYAESNSIGWGSIGTLSSAIPKGSVNRASHKAYAFAFRLIDQLHCVTVVDREFDRIVMVTLVSGRTLRIGMILEYEPAADHVRDLWKNFGAIDIAWNINPNGSPTPSAIEAGRGLGCKVLKWDDLKPILQKG